MDLVITEEQQLLRDSAREFVSASQPLRRIRMLRDSKDPTGFSLALWAEMAQLGWTGILFPEKYGGSGLGYSELAVVMEELGRGLMPEPMLSTVLLGGNAILLGGSEEQRQNLLPPLIAGKLLMTLAYHEPGARYDLFNIETRAERTNSGWRLRGTKDLVPDGHVAERMVVAARTDANGNERSGITLFLVDSRAAGVSVTRQATIDSRGVAIVTFENVEVGDADVVGEPNAGGRLLADVVDRATVGLCAEMLGGMSAAFEMTLDYLKTRKQFGVFIGTFQALKHRAAMMFIENELSRSAVMVAARAADTADPKLPKLVSIAKARCSDAFILIGNEGIQMHGGIGMTDEHDIGFFVKRARAAAVTFGDAAFHRNRYAEIEAY